MPRAVNGLKLCIVCGVTKTVFEFNKQSIRPDGLAYECRDCNKARKVRDRLAPKKRLIKAAGCY